MTLSVEYQKKLYDTGAYKSWLKTRKIHQKIFEIWNAFQIEVKYIVYDEKFTGTEIRAITFKVR